MGTVALQSCSREESSVLSCWTSWMDCDLKFDEVDPNGL